jgi:hypothetical protein
MLDGGRHYLQEALADLQRLRPSPHIPLNRL